MIIKNTSLRFKLFIVIFSVVIIPMVIMCTLLYIRAEQAITEQTSKVVISSIDFASNNIDSSLEVVAGMSKLLLTDTRLQATAKIERMLTESEKPEKYREIRELLNFFISRIKVLNINSGIESYYLYLKNQNTIIDTKSTFYDKIQKQNVDFINKSESRKYNGNWFSSVPVDFYSLNKIESRLEPDKTITYNEELFDDNGKVLGVLAVNIKESFVSEYYKKIQTGITGDFGVFDSNGTLIAYSEKKLVGKNVDKFNELNKNISTQKKPSGSFFVNMDQEYKFVVYSVSKYTKWRYVVMIPASDIFGKVYSIRDFLIITLTIMILLVFGITFQVSRQFYKPLEKLVHAMQKIENRNLEVRIDDKRKDEYQRVYRGFNTMVMELKHLIKDLTNEKLLKKEAEIKLLQAQINPHFLYNTLDSIYSIAKIKKVDEISQMVYALSKFFRISLSGGKDMVTLKMAVELVLNYLTIRNIRFKGKIEYEVSIPDDLMNCSVPKLILQPIVENSIYHGLEKRTEQGRILIKADALEGNLLLSVEDDGMGMEEQVLETLRASIQNESFEEEKNFALKNLNRQIKLKFGSSYGLDIESRYEQGTVVTVKLPII